VAALGNLPSDPGYDFLADVDEFGFRSFFLLSEKYVQVAPRLVAWGALQFPIEHRALILQVLAVAIIAVLGAVVSWAIEIQTNSRLIGGLLGLVFLTIPAARESTLGNAGSLKWPLLAALGLVAVCPKFYLKFMWFTALFTAFVGLSSPMFVVALLPILWFAGTHRASIRQLQPTLFAGSLGFVIQGFAWLLKNRQVKIYGDSIQQTPWPGMGVFWYLVWVGPTIAAVAVIVTVSVLGRHLTWRGSDIRIATLWLSGISIILSILVHLSAGIKDSAAVATQTLSWSAVVLVSTSLLSTRTINWWLRFAAGLALALIVILSAKWFKASPYLAGGPTWSSEVKRAAQECRSSMVDDAQIQLNLAVVEISCEELR
jgi:hypothetical protein